MTAVRRSLTCLLAALCALLLLAAPAAADDIFEIDGRLQDAGLAEGYTESIPAERGARVVVDFSSSSRDRAAYEAEALKAAELVWLHLEEEVQTVDVAPTYGVGWLGGDLPPGVSYSRAELEEQFGPRAEELDVASELEGFGDDAFFGGVVIGGILLGLLLLGALVVLVVVLLRRSGKAQSAWTQPQWGQPPWQPQWGGQPPWGGPPHGAPAPWGPQPQVATDPAGPQQHPPPPAGDGDPWRPPQG